MQQLRRTAQVDESRCDVLMAEIGRHIRQLRFRIDAFSVPVAHAMTHHRVTKVVYSWSYPPPDRLESRSAQHPDQQNTHRAVRVSLSEPFTPEDVAVRTHGSSGFLAGC